jgi:circadian clock protein KaiC
MSATQPGTPRSAVEKHPTGIPGFDFIAEGGLPRRRATLIAGTAGSAKTVFAAQFLAEGIEAGERGVFVTFEDSVADIRTNMMGFGWDIPAWERDGQWQFVDATPDPEEPVTVVGSFDLGALLARVERAVERTRATRVSLDSLNALFVQYRDHAMLRAELFRITSRLKKAGLTVVFTGERTEEYGEVSRHGIEEFVADNVIILRNLLENERRRRTMEILKFRGAPHQRGEFPFTITSQGGITVLPLTERQLTQSSSTVRISSGIGELDAMCGGGFFRDSVVLVSGATGTGKTLLVTQFLAGGTAAGEKSLLFAFEESHDQLYRNAAAWGMDFARMERDGLLKVVNRYPHAMAMEDHLIEIMRTIEEFGPARVVVDSLSALERVASVRSFREFVITLTSFLKSRETVGLFTSTTASLLGGGSVTEKHISTLTDSIILLRYVESFGEMRRSLTVLKMRGSAHDVGIREFTIDEHGMRIGPRFRDVTGILSGHVTHAGGSSLAAVGRSANGDGDGDGEDEGEAEGEGSAEG